MTSHAKTIFNRKSANKSVPSYILSPTFSFPLKSPLFWRLGGVGSPVWIFRGPGAVPGIGDSKRHASDYCLWSGVI